MKASNTNTLRLGLFGIGLDTYCPQFAGLAARLKSYLEKVAEKLKRPGVQVISLGLVNTPEKALGVSGFDVAYGWRTRISDLVSTMCRSTGCRQRVSQQCLIPGAFKER